MIAGDAVRVDPLSAVQRERVEPDRHPLEDLCGGLRIRIDRDQIGDLTLGVGRLRRRLQNAILDSSILAQRDGVSSGLEALPAQSV